MNELEQKINYAFKNGAFLKAALTHSSYANESRESSLKCNERLEFLGDSVLNFVTAEYLFENLEVLPEGELTKIRATVVCEGALHEIALGFELGRFLLLGRGEDMNRGRDRPSILADAVEALFAAVYLDGGIDAAKNLILSQIAPMINRAVSGRMMKDYKTQLQEIVQKNRQEVLSYSLKNEEGPDHDKIFTVEVYLNSNPVASGTGKSKKEAEQQAARAALELMGEE